MTATKYLKDGQEVIVEREIDGGFLIKQKFEYPMNEEDESDDEGMFLGEQMFVERVFDAPPTEKLATEIVELNKKKENISLEIAELKRIKQKENSTLNKISRIPKLQMVVDYLNGDFKHVLSDKHLIIKEAQRIYNSKNICVEMVKGEIQLYVLQNEYFGSDKLRVEVFPTKEEAEAERRKRFLKLIENTTYEYNLQGICDDTYYFSDLLADEEIKTIIENKRTVLLKKSKEQIIENAKKEIEKYEKILENNTN